MSLNRFIGCTLASMAIAASTSACMQNELPGDELEDVGLPEQSEELADLDHDPEMDLIEAESGGQSLWTVVEDGAQGLGLVEEPSTEAGCVRIEWCDKPDSKWGTVCIWDRCSFDAAVRECTIDANYVCGGITQPALIR
jgi:hypothetical protein